MAHISIAPALGAVGATGVATVKVPEGTNPLLFWGSAVAFALVVALMVWMFIASSRASRIRYMYITGIFFLVLLVVGAVGSLPDVPERKTPCAICWQ